MKFVDKIEGKVMMHIPIKYYLGITAVCIVLAAGSEIQANLQFNIFSFLPFVPFTGGAL